MLQTCRRASRTCPPLFVAQSTALCDRTSRACFQWKPFYYELLLATLVDSSGSLGRCLRWRSFRRHRDAHYSSACCAGANSPGRLSFRRWLETASLVNAPFQYLPALDVAASADTCLMLSKIIETKFFYLDCISNSKRRFTCRCRTSYFS